MLLSLLLSAAFTGGGAATESASLNRAFHEAAKGDQRAARVDFFNARELNENDPVPLRAIFFTDLQLGDFHEAARIARIYSDRYPLDETVRLNDAFVLVRLHKYADARAIFSNLSRSKDAKIRTVARAGRRNVAALMRAGSAAAIAADDTASPSLGAAYAHERQGQFAAAVSSFRSYLAEHPANHAAQLDLAYAYVRLHDTVRALGAFERYLQDVPGDDRVRLARAYQLLALRRTADARAAFVALQTSRDTGVAKRAGGELASLPAVSPAPAKPGVNWLDLAYGYQRTNDHAAALAAFDSYLAVDPTNDRIRLARGYEAYAHGDRARAEDEFKSLEDSPDESVAVSARKQVEAIAGGAHRERYGADAFAVVEYDSRFQDVFFNVDSRVVASSRGVEPYAFYRLATDSRSRTTGTAPVIFNDNTTVGGLGLRVALNSSASTYSFIEAGRGVSLLGRPATSDLRIGVASSSSETFDSGARNSVDWSVASYSRYTGDIIGYGQATRDFPLGSPRIRGVFGARAAFDSHREYYNNILELEAGVQVGTPSIALRVMGVGGSYLPLGTHLTVHRLYATLRPELIYSKSL